MTIPTFPTLIGLSEVVKRSPKWSTMRQESVSGRRTDLQLWSYPRYDYELTYNFLRGDASAEFQTLVGFYNQVKSGSGLFAFTDPQDFSVTNQVLGTGDGATTHFQLVRTWGGFTEPVFMPAVVPVVYRTTAIGVEALSAAVRTNDVHYSVPGTVTAGALGSGGALPTGWNLDALSGLTRTVVGRGVEGGLTYLEIRVSGTATGTVGIEADAWAGAYTSTAVCSSFYARLTAGSWANVAVSANAYLAGAGAISNGLVVIVPTGAALNTQRFSAVGMAGSSGNSDRTALAFTVSGAVDFTVRVAGFQQEVGIAPTAYIPTTSAAVTVQDFTLAANGVIVFGTAPAASVPLTWSGTYAWLARFTDDTIDFNAFAYQFWSSGTIKLSSEKL
jgi:uncharacterized protein (TIGR02217 family)